MHLLGGPKRVDPPNSGDRNRLEHQTQQAGITIARMKGPPITVSCHCGEARHVPYEETWQCERCGRKWNTSQIPAEVYWGIMREMRNYRLILIATVIGVAAIFGLVALFVSPGLLLMFPVILAGWFIGFMPWWRRRLRRRARALPTWKLEPE